MLQIAQVVLVYETLLSNKWCRTGAYLTDVREFFELVDTRCKKLFHVILHGGGQSAMGQSTVSPNLAAAKIRRPLFPNRNLRLDRDVLPEKPPPRGQVLLGTC